MTSLQLTLLCAYARGLVSLFLQSSEMISGFQTVSPYCLTALVPDRAEKMPT